MASVRAKKPLFTGDKNEIITKIKNSKLSVTVNSIEDKPQDTRIDKLIEDAREHNETLVFIFTPSSYLPTEALPSKWMSTEEAVGCTPHLQILKDLKARIFAINPLSSEKQAGPDGFIAQKGLRNIRMISDSNGSIYKSFNIPDFSLNDAENSNDLADKKRYPQRLTVVIKPDGQTELFAFDSQVNPQLAQEHLAAIENFLSLRCETQNEKSSSLRL